MPGLATVLVGDDPASQSYVKMKHRDCEEVGIASIRVRPARRRHDGPAAGGHRVASTPTRPAPATSCSCRIPRHLDENWALGLIDPDKDADGLHPINLGRLVLNEPATLPCTPRGIVELLRRHGVELARRRGVRRGSRHHGRTSARPDPHPAQRELDRHAVPHRDARPRRPHPGRRHRGGRRRRAGHDHRRHDPRGRRAGRRRRQPRRRQDGRRPRPGRLGEGGLGHAQPGRGRAR